MSSSATMFTSLSIGLMAGVTVAPITTRFEDGFHLPPREEIEAVVTDKTAAIILCNPANGFKDNPGCKAAGLADRLCLPGDLRQPDRGAGCLSPPMRCIHDAVAGQRRAEARAVRRCRSW